MAAAMEAAPTPPPQAADDVLEAEEELSALESDATVEGAPLVGRFTASPRTPPRGATGWEGEDGDCTRGLWLCFLVVGALSAAALAGISVYLFVYVHRWGHSELAVWAAIYCAVFATVSTGFQIHLHLTSYTNPAQQRRIIRILLMVPVYAVASACALKWYKGPSLYIGLLRDTYEAFVLYTFFALMLDYLGGPAAALDVLQSTGAATVDHPAPLCCLKPVQIDTQVILRWKLCVVQFLLLKPLISFTAMVLHATDVLGGDNEYNPRKPGLYLLILENLSVTLAFTCLFYFYLAAKKALAPHNPTGKFIAIKLVVFLCFWQGIGISVLVHLGLIHDSAQGTWDANQVANGFQNFLVCVEMLGVSVLHKYTFSHVPYLPASGLRKASARLNDIAHAVVDVRDVHADVEWALPALPGRRRSGNPRGGARGVGG